MLGTTFVLDHADKPINKFRWLDFAIFVTTTRKRTGDASVWWIIIDKWAGQSKQPVVPCPMPIWHPVSKDVKPTILPFDIPDKCFCQFCFFRGIL